MWQNLRAITQDDMDKLDKRAVAFVKRHQLPLEEDGPSKMRFYVRLDYYISDLENYDREDVSAKGRRLRKLWIGVLRRATGEKQATEIAHGCIGYRL